MDWNRGQLKEKPEPGSYLARCYSLIDLGTQQHAFNNEVWNSRDVRISFELPTELMKGIYQPELKGKPFAVHITVKQSLHPSAKLRGLLRGWRGRDFTKEELASFKPQKLIGVACRVVLVASATGEFINIDSVSPLSKGEKCPKQVNPSVFFSLDPGEYDPNVLKSLSEKTQATIMTSPEYKLLSDEGSQEAQQEDAADEERLPDQQPGGEPF